jgi:mitochondrial enoyl-[acyl-carrier protein] reductase / trans-2-enoyl-CoA reductase
MSKKPIQIPTSLFIFKNISLHGFWLSKWVESHSAKEREEMLTALGNHVKKGELRLWIERHKFSQYQQAIETATSSAPHKKVLLQLDL